MKKSKFRKKASKTKKQAQLKSISRKEIFQKLKISAILSISSYDRVQMLVHCVRYHITRIIIQIGIINSYQLRTKYYNFFSSEQFILFLENETHATLIQVK